MSPITVAVIEDEADIREMLTRAIRKARQLSFVGAFSDAESALAQLATLAPNVVVMDLQLPGIDGIECTRRVKQLLPDTQVLVFTVFLDSDQIYRALEAGANGYLLKRTARQDILEAIEQVWQGGAPMSGEVARKVVASFRATDPRNEPCDAEHLTEREEQVLKRLASGLGTKAIATELNLSAETVRFHLKHIYEKLHVRSRTEAVIKYLR